MLTGALVATGHGYEKSERGRCEAFDPYEIIANPLGEWSEADRERRTFAGKSGPGVTYGSHALYLMRRKDAPPGERDLFIAVHNGSGRQIWRIPACFNYAAETADALCSMPERALYSLLYGIVDALDTTKRAAEEATSAEWRRATLEKRVKVSRQPAKSRAFVWIEPAPIEGEDSRSYEIRKAFAKPSGVR